MMIEKNRMSFLAYLKDRRIDIALLCGGVGLFCFGLWLDPLQQVRAATLVYIATLSLLAGAGNLWRQYRRARRFLDRLAAVQASDDTPLVGRTAYQREVAAAVDRLQLTHRESYNHLLVAHQDQAAFIESWVHEIKLPLAAAGLLADEATDFATKSALHHQLRRVDHYVAQVLYYARMDSFAHDYLLATCFLQAQVEQVIVGLRDEFIQGRLSVAIEGDDLQVVTDGKWLRFILTQLFSNALKYTAPGGHITVTLASLANEVTLTIQDDGIGIAADELPRVFDKGFTGTNGRVNDTKSTGLGLYLAQRLSERLGHHLTIASTPHVGTAVTLHFPRLSYFDQQDETVGHGTSSYQWFRQQPSPPKQAKGSENQQ
ncbi:sensor histidine kinase [Lacticaseibacillus kribbianus]|uniref:sensor histidine kinase n=1 Tax=Lacticaseibacillus kribbianus TaxID=2926292 RepID=UPI001CD4459E|nr:sensor histidine kinase [Lacticaseibacillus kribbianus]